MPPPTGTGTRGPPRWSALLKLPAWSVAVLVWPIALLILGVRLKRLNRDSLTSSSLSPRGAAATAKVPLIFRPDDLREWDETQLWPAILLTFFLLMGTSHETFYYVTALRRPEPLAGGRSGGTSAGTSLAAAGIESTERPMSTSMRGGGGRAVNGDALLEANDVGSRSSLFGRARRTVRGRRNQFPVAVALGLAGAFLIQLGWALVGTVGLASSLPSTVVTAATSTSDATLVPVWTAVVVVPTGNLLSDPRLPRADPYLIAVRVLVWFAIVTQLEAHAHVGLARTRRFLSFLRPLSLAPPRRQQRRRRRQGGRVQSNGAIPAGTITEEDDRPDSSRKSSSRGGYRYRLAARRVLARVGFYSTAVLAAWMTIAVPMWRRERHHGRKDVGGHGSGLVGLAEWSGVGIAGIGGCLVPGEFFSLSLYFRSRSDIVAVWFPSEIRTHVDPRLESWPRTHARAALAYLVLFHLRRPRLILVSDPDSPQFSNDDLLQRKEREMQRRLSGRRIGTDLGVFGVLGPVGVVLVVRGLVAMVRRTAGAGAGADGT